MAQESNEGIAYLMALKQPASATAASAAAPAREATAEGQMGAAGAPAQSFAGKDKRRSARYKCEGGVEIREDGCDVPTRATFTDVSLHGCYVEAQATYSVGTMLTMKLEAKGIKVETKGTVKVNYPYLGMGIAFGDMSDENRTHLRELLRAIARPSAIIGPGIASTLPATGPMQAVPQISKPEAAIQALVSFFEERQMLMRDDFLRILRKSQG